MTRQFAAVVLAKQILIGVLKNTARLLFLGANLQFGKLMTSNIVGKVQLLNDSILN